MAKEKHFGRCALCGKECELTFEHIPPRKAFNWLPQKSYSGNTIIDMFGDPDRLPWDFTDLPSNNDQRGLGAYTLCSNCNSFTGARYGNEYINFVKGFHSVLQSIEIEGAKALDITTGKIRPLPILKQICSLFCSLHQQAGENSDFELLRRFVLDENSMAFPKDKFKIGMYIFGGGLLRRCPITAKGLSTPSGFKVEYISEITTYPLGFLLYVNPEDSLVMPCVDISLFSDFQLNQTAELSITLPIYECNTMVPADFRSKSDIERCNDTNVKD